MSAKDKAAVAKNHTWKIIMGLAISVVFLYLALKNLDLKQFVQAFRQWQPLWVIIAAVLIIIAYVLRALLWKKLILGRKATHTWNLFRIITLGYLANNLLPLKIGEVLRAWLLGRKEQLPTSLAIGTVVVERIMDLFALLFYFAVAMAFMPFAKWLKMSGLVIGLIGIGLAGGIALTYFFGEKFTAWLERPLLRLHARAGEWLHVQITKFVEGLRLIKTPGQLLAAFGWCLATWLAWIGVAYASCRAFDLQVSWLAPVFIIVVLNFGLMIPSSPGGLGVFEYMIILALAPFGISKETALGVGFTFHGLQYILTALLGWIFAMQMNVSMTKAAREAEESETEADAAPTGSGAGS